MVRICRKRPGTYGKVYRSDHTRVENIECFVEKNYLYEKRAYHKDEQNPQEPVVPLIRFARDSRDDARTETLCTDDADASYY